jgi:hypothetical protein
MTDQEIQEMRQARFIDNLKAVHLDLLILRNASGTKTSKLVAAADEAVQTEILAG